jgi:hypothetical protein
MNPLAPLGRQDECWCGSGRTYRLCHKRWAQPRSAPGAKLPPDPVGGRYLSPSVLLADSALPMMMPEGGVPLVIPPDRPHASAIVASHLETLVAHAKPFAATLSPQKLGLLRLEVLTELSTLASTDKPLRDAQLQGIVGLALASYECASALAMQNPRPTLLWNDELAPNDFLTRTLLLADHVLVPDRVFARASARSSVGSIAKLAKEELELRELILSGRVIAVPNGVARAIAGSSIDAIVKEDLSNAKLVSFIENQLVFEGPDSARSPVRKRQG